MVYYFYCIVLIHYAGKSWGIDAYNICMCIYTYIFRCNVYQCMIYYTSSYRSATVALHNLLSSFKTIPTVAPRLLSINSRAGKTKKPLIQNIGGPSGQLTKRAADNDAPCVCPV